MFEEGLKSLVASGPMALLMGIAVVMLWRKVAELARTKHVIKGFHFDPDELMRWNDCPHIDILLVDGSAGGLGEGFDHEALAALMPKITKPVIVAGGLRSDNVAQAIRAVRPFAVDVSSGVESAPGVKDPELVRQFCAAVAAVD